MSMMFFGSISLSQAPPKRRWKFKCIFRINSTLFVFMDIALRKCVLVLCAFPVCTRCGNESSRAILCWLLLLYIVERAFRALSTGSVPSNNNEIETIKLKRREMCARIVFRVGFSAFSVASNRMQEVHIQKKLLPEKPVIQLQFSPRIRFSGIQFHCNVNLLYSTIRYFFSRSLSAPIR